MDFWNEKEPSFHYENFGRLANLHKNFWNWLYHKPFDSVLEIGPGVGIYADFFNDKRYAGVDVHEKLIQWLDQTYEGTFYLGHFLTTQFDEKYDLVFAHNVIEHSEDPDEFLKKMMRLSSKYIYLGVHTGLHRTLRKHKIIKKDGYYENKLSVLKLQTLLDEADFDVVVDYFNYHGKYSPGMIIKAVKKY